jgi:SAM-dependent methyltransferase
MPSFLQRTLARIEEVNEKYASKLERQFSAMDATFFERAENLLAPFEAFMQSKGREFNYGVDCHLKLRDSMIAERMDFLRSGRYRSSSFEEVRQRVYEDPSVMETHMYGLVFAQVLWPEQYARFCFFAENLPRYRDAINSYLEVGGGHAWYIKVAVSLLEPGTRFDLLDISPTSIELAKALSPNDRIQYRLADIVKLPKTELYDFISIGEVIEHLEQPMPMLEKVREMLTANGRVFLSTPVNSPTLDHIYLFNTAQEIRDLLNAAGFEIELETTRYSEDVSVEKAEKHKVALMFASFLRKRA